MGARVAPRFDVDLSLLDFCRDDCGDDSLHPPHGPRAGAVTVLRSTQEVFVGPAVAYRCRDCGMETIGAPERCRPHCGYCHGPRTVSTGLPPGGLLCHGGEVPPGTERGPCPACGRITDVLCTVSTELCRGTAIAGGGRRGPCVDCGRDVALLRAGTTRPHRPQTPQRTWRTRAHRPFEGDTVDPVLTDVVFDAVGHNIPTPFADVYGFAVDTYGGRVSERSTQRALSTLIAARQVVSIGCASWSPQRQRSTALSGYYIRYDSPKLWRPDGLRDLMSVVAQADDDLAQRAGVEDAPPLDRPTHRPSRAQSQPYRDAFHAFGQLALARKRAGIEA